MSALTTPGYGFSVLASDGAARAGLLVTPHGEVPTPTFMPVGTQGSVKTLTPGEVAETGARVVPSRHPDPTRSGSDSSLRLCLFAF